MRFYNKENAALDRKKTFFAIWPVTINGETRWLEWVTVYSQRKIKPHGSFGGVKPYGKFINKSFS